MGRPRGEKTEQVRVYSKDAQFVLDLTGVPVRTPWPVAFREALSRIKGYPAERKP
jgi:hypothetical protein